MRLQKVSINVSETRARWPSSLSCRRSRLKRSPSNYCPNAFASGHIRRATTSATTRANPLRPRMPGTSQQKNSGSSSLIPRSFSSDSAPDEGLCQWTEWLDARVQTPGTAPRARSSPRTFFLANVDWATKGRRGSARPCVGRAAAVPNEARCRSSGGSWRVDDPVDLEGEATVSRLSRSSRWVTIASSSARRPPNHRRRRVPCGARARPLPSGRFAADSPVGQVRRKRALEAPAGDGLRSASTVRASAAARMLSLQTPIGLDGNDAVMPAIGERDATRARRWAVAPRRRRPAQSRLVEDRGDGGQFIHPAR